MYDIITDLIENKLHDPHFCKKYVKWLQINHNRYYFACMLIIEKKMCHACHTPLINLLSE